MRLRSFWRATATWTFLALLTLATGAFAQATGPWKLKRFSLSAHDRDLVDVLNEFGKIEGVSLNIDPTVRGTISGEFNDVEPAQFLNGLAEASNFVWFYDGSRLYIENARDVTSRVVKVQYVTPETVSESMRALGFLSGPEGREGRVGGDGGVISLVGGPEFLRLTENIVKELEAQESNRRGMEVQIKTFKLKHAFAEDIRVSGTSTVSVIPGVARILQNLMAGGSSSPLSTGVFQYDQRDRLVGLRGTGLAAVGGVPEPELPGPSLISNAPSAPPPVAEMAVIQADPRTNTVIVKDVASRFPLYEEVLRLIDTPANIIEISVAIVDLDLNDALDLGVDYAGTVKIGDSRIGFGFRPTDGEGNGTGVQPAENANALTDTLNLARLGGGFNASALIVDGASQLLARIRLLQERGYVNIISSPAVLTVENLEATFQQNETVYVRVAGREQVDLFDVTTGVQLRVTPTVFKTPNNQLNIRLLLDIRDGTFLPQQVDQIPATRESVITTQAVVPNNKSLWIGGYMVERWSENVSQVPKLGDVPVLGYLFKRKIMEKRRTQRFFFITPRIVNIQMESDSLESDKLVRRAVPIHAEEAAIAKERLRASRPWRPVEWTDTVPPSGNTPDSPPSSTPSKSRYRAPWRQ